MRVSFALRTSALTALLLMTAISAHAQYFDHTPRAADVEVDLSVLDGPGARASQPQAIMAPTRIESAPLPPLNLPSGSSMPVIMPPPVTAIPPRPIQAAPLLPSPYERQRVIERVELNGSAPYRPAAPSPFNPPAVLKAPVQAPMEMPRTAPATVVDRAALSPLDGGDPLLITGEEMPAQNVSTDIKSTPRIMKPPTAAHTAPVMKPTRKPDTLPAIEELHPSDLNVEELTLDAPAEIPVVMQQPAPIVMIDEEPPQVSPMPPEVKKSAEAVMHDLGDMPELVDEPMPVMADAGVTATSGTEPPAAGLLIFDGDAIALDEAMRDTLSGVLKTLNKDENSRLLIRGYASSSDGSRATARRVSLSRALAVRAHLMDNGLTPTRVDVRAMGTDSSITPLDRVDLVIAP